MPTEKQRTVLLIDDSAEDRATYCRYLQRGSVHDYQILEAGSGAVGLDLCQRSLPDAILLDYSLPDMDGLEFLAAMQQAGKHVPILMLTGQGDETIAAQAIKSGAQDYLIKGNLTAEELCRAVEHAIEQWQLQQQLQRHEQQRQIVNAIALKIRQSLQLKEILETTVTEVRQFLNTDRVVIYRFQPDMNGTIITEAVLPGWKVVLGEQVQDPCFQHNAGGDYRAGKNRAIDDIYQAGLTACHVQLLERFEVKANLVAPIIVKGELWGLLIAHQCAAPRQWQTTELNLLDQLVVQIAIAIQQATAYQQAYQQAQAELVKRQHIEVILSETAQRYATLTEMSPVGIFQADALGNCLYVNDRWCQIAGLSPTEAMGFGWVNGIHPDDRERVSTEWSVAAQANRPFHLEYRFQNAAGQMTWVLGQAVAERDVSGELVGYVGTITDITDRKQKEVTQSQLATIVESSTDAIISKTLDGAIGSWNKGAEKLFGYTAAEAIGRSILLLIPAAFRHEEAAIARRLKCGEPIEHYETVRQHKDGRLIDVSLTVSPLKDATGAIVGASKIVRDISVRKQIEAERKQTEITLKQLNQKLETRVQERTAKLQASEARLQEAQRIAHLGDWEFALASQTITWSEELFRLFGLDASQGEPEYAEHIQSYVPESRLQLEHAVQQAATLGTPYELELQFSRADGLVRWLLARGEAIRDVDGAIVKLLGTALDITDRKQTEAQLQNLSDRLTLAVKSGAIAIWDWNVTENILTWDDRMYELYGITPDRFTSVYDAWASSLHPDDRSLAEVAIQQALAGEKDYDPEFRVIHPDGTIRFIKAYALVERNERGEPHQMIGINYDITDRKQPELENQQLKERLQFILASNPAVIFTCEPDGDYAATFISDNIQTVGGYTPTEFLSESGFWAKHLHPEDAPHILAGLTALFEQGHHTHEYRFLHKDGSYRWMRNGLRLVRDAHGNMIEIVGYFADITDRKQSEQALQQLTIDLQRSNQELEQFAYVASHDLQEPLRAITSYTQLLAKRYQGQLDEKADKYIYYVVDGATRMQQLIQDLLAYSRVGRYELKRQPTDCNRVLEQVRQDLQVAIAESHALLSVDVLPTILADTAQVTQLFQNLIGNALKYRGQAPPLIHVAAKQQGKEWAFSIQDNGIGIEPQYAERIFEIFQRLHTRREYEGTGLGLAICKKIVERHRGRLWVTSALGQGATFCFTLPAAPNYEYPFFEN